MTSDRLDDWKRLEEKFLSVIKMGDGGPKEEFQLKRLDRSVDYLNVNWELHHSEEFQFKCGDYRNLNWELYNSFHHINDKSEKGSGDVCDLLPSDPFGMELIARLTSIAWIEEMDKDFGYGKDEKTEAEKTGDDRLFAGMNLVLKGPLKTNPEVGDNKNLGQEVQEPKTNDCDGDEGAPPPDALLFALGHLGVRDLLSVECVCKTLRAAIRDDPLLWRSIHIDQPLSKSFTDDALIRLTSRAQRSLKCLSLVQCAKITDSGIKRVLQSNPAMTKLSVPGCVKLSVDGIISNLNALKSAGLPGIQSLRIGGRLGVTHKHFEELKCMLAVDNDHLQQLSLQKPRFYQGGQLYLPFDDDRAIDVEECPMCQEIRQVYDCPAESCQSKKPACRGCTCCIARCNTCGCCVSDCDFVEAFCLDLHCLDCWKQIMSRQKINYFYFCG